MCTKRVQIFNLVGEGARLPFWQGSTQPCSRPIPEHVLNWTVRECSKDYGVRRRCSMATPIKVPIADNVLMGDNKLQSRETVSVAAILKRCKTSLIADWLTRTKRTPELNCVQLSDEQ